MQFVLRKKNIIILVDNGVCSVLVGRIVLASYYDCRNSGHNFSYLSGICSAVMCDMPWHVNECHRNTLRCNLLHAFKIDLDQILRRTNKNNQSNSLITGMVISTIISTNLKKWIDFLYWAWAIDRLRWCAAEKPILSNDSGSRKCFSFFC